MHHVFTLHDCYQITSASGNGHNQELLLKEHVTMGYEGVRHNTM